MAGTGKGRDDLGEGVLFAKEDCTSLLARIAILLIDLAVIVGAFLGIAFAAMHGLAEQDDSIKWRVVLLSIVVFVFLYLVVLESSRFGTAGFAIFKVKIVNLKGQRPSVFRMTFRLMLWALGPFHPIVDLFWVSNDRSRQTLRDKLAGTYVVKRTAVPIASGRIRAVHLFICGFSILFPEVRKEQKPEAASS